MSIILKNSSSYAAKKGNTDWWNWTAYIECTPPDSLDEIAYVEYHLHPTFPNPVKRVRHKEGGFPLETKGWGLFVLKAKVIFKESSRKTLILSHLIEFEN